MTIEANYVKDKTLREKIPPLKQTVSRVTHDKRLYLTITKPNHYDIPPILETTLTEVNNIKEELPQQGTDVSFYKCPHYIPHCNKHLYVHLEMSSENSETMNERCGITSHPKFIVDGQELVSCVHANTEGEKNVDSMKGYISRRVPIPNDYTSFM